MNKSPRNSLHDGPEETSDRTGMMSDVPDIPDKLYFKIGEVSAITGVEAHVLRYWESEIKVIRPQRASSKQRLYRRIDIENILTIKKLIHEDGYTLPGARKFLLSKKTKGTKPEKIVERGAPVKPDIQEFCKEMKAGLEEIRKMLEV